MEEQEADIIEVEHALAYPFLFILSVFKWASLLVAVGLWSAASWVFGVFGGNSMISRIHQAEHIRIVTQVNPTSAPDRDWRMMVLDFGEPEMHADADKSIGKGTFPDFCGRSPYSQVAPGPITSRAADATARKEAKMRLVLQNAIMMTRALRRSLTALKLHRELPADAYTPDYWDNLCVTYPYLPYMDQDVYESQVETASKISLEHLPSVDILFFHGRVAGLCIESLCNLEEEKNDLTYKVTWLEDLFADQPPLTHGQAIAFGSLKEASTDDFWIHAAHVKRDR
jgi:hypothetical protein